MNTPASNRTLVLILLTLTYGFSFIDRQIVGILAPYIKADLGITTAQMGWLMGFAFALLYTIVGIPIAMLADKFNRVNVITISLVLWSGFTALTGMASNFMQIGLARVGVGIGEAGGSPPSHSIISDLYPKEKRASALGVYSLGIPFGIMAAYFTTAALMGADSQAVDWRRIFIILGVSGVIFAVILRLLVREPDRGAQESTNTSVLKTYSFKDNLKTLLSIPSWWLMCLGIACASFSAYAFSGFQTIYLRQFDPDYSMRSIIFALGFINGIAYAAGTFFGARLADKFGQKNVRAYAIVSAIAVLFAFPFAVYSFWAASVPLHLVGVTLMLICLGVYLGPSFAIAQTLAPIHMRAMSTALFFFILNMIAMGGGPTFTGMLIGHLEKTHAALDATRFGMTAVCGMMVVGAIFFYLASRTLPKDWADAQKRNEGIEN